MSSDARWAPAPLPVASILAFGMPYVGYSFVFFFVQFYFLKFATDVLLLAPAAVGLLFGIGRIWDALSDPLAGYLSDRTRTSLGRRRPWLIGALIPIFVTSALLWNPPAEWPPGAVFLWVTASLLLFYSATTAYQVPYQALGAELSLDYHERTRLFAVQSVSQTVGMLLSFLAIQWVTNAESAREAVSTVSFGVQLVAVALLILPALLLRERPDFQNRTVPHPYKAIRDVFRNPHARILLVVWLIQGLGGAVLGILTPYIAEYILDRPDRVAALPAFFILSSVISVPFWVRLARHIGKRNVWQIGMVGLALSFGATFFVHEGDLTILYVLLVFAGVSFGCGQVAGPAMLADVIDYDELATGERKEGAYSATWGFTIKAAVALQVMITGAVLEIAGFVPNQPQTETAKLALRLLFAGLPLVFFLLGAYLFRTFRLNEKEHSEIRRALDARNA